MLQPRPGAPVNRSSDSIGIAVVVFFDPDLMDPFPWFFLFWPAGQEKREEPARPAGAEPWWPRSC